MNTSPQQQPNNATTSSTPSPTLQQTTSELHLIKNSNSAKVLLAMAVGLDLGDGEIFKGKFDEKFPLAHRSKELIFLPTMAVSSQ